MPLDWEQGFGVGCRVPPHPTWTEIRFSIEEATGARTYVCTCALVYLGVKLGEKESEHTVPFTCLTVSNSTPSSRGHEW